MSLQTLMYNSYMFLDPSGVNMIKVFANVQFKSIYVESQVIGPLADDSVSWIAGVGHLVLKDVIASRSITVFIKQNSSASTTYKSQRKEDSYSAIIQETSLMSLFSKKINKKKLSLTCFYFRCIYLLSYLPKTTKPF